MTNSASPSGTREMRAWLPETVASVSVSTVRGSAPISERRPICSVSPNVTARGWRSDSGEEPLPTT
jgi:hypothetical protein